MIDRFSCRIHRPVLLDFVDRGEVAPSAAPAMAHLERCHRCTRELEATVRTITAMRRLGAEAALVEPSPDAWSHLRAQLERSRAATRRTSWLWRVRLGSMMASALIVALVVGPATTVAPVAREGVDISNAERSAVRAREIRADATFIASVGVGNRSGPEADNALSIESKPVNYPDGVRPQAKEVSSTKSPKWPLTAT
jgi:hypothetical protein